MTRIGEKNLCEPISACNVAPLLHLFPSHSFLCYGLRQVSLTNQLEALAHSLNFRWAFVQTGAEQQLVFTKTPILSFDCLPDAYHGEKLGFVRPPGYSVCVQLMFDEVR